MAPVLLTLNDLNVSFRGPVWRDFLLALLKDLFKPSTADALTSVTAVAMERVSGKYTYYNFVSA